MTIWTGLHMITGSESRTASKFTYSYFFLNLWPQDLEFLFPIFHTRWSLPRPLQLTNDSFLNYFQEAALQKLAWALYFEINPEHCRNCLAQIRNVSFLACVTPTTQIRNPPMDKTVCADHIILYKKKKFKKSPCTRTWRIRTSETTLFCRKCVNIKEKVHPQAR